MIRGGVGYGEGFLYKPLNVAVHLYKGRLEDDPLN